MRNMVTVSLRNFLLIIITTVIFSLFICLVINKIKKGNLYKKQVEKERIRNDLLRCITHDIRTPLTSISGISQLLIDSYECLNDKVKLDMIKDIADDAQWLIHIVENGLSITKLGKDVSSEIAMTQELAEEVVEAAVTKVRKRHPDAIIKVEIPDEPRLVWMNPILIEQVLINFIENSLIHAHNASFVMIRIEERIKELLFEVIDDGNGVDENLLLSDNSDFSEFNDQEDLLKKNMGIGLSVCKTIVESHKGVFGVNNIRTGGVKFWFTLPKR